MKAQEGAVRLQEGELSLIAQELLAELQAVDPHPHLSSAHVPLTRIPAQN